MATLDERQLADYFSRRFGAPVTILKTKPSFPGISRETWLVFAEVAGERRDFALRLDHAWGGSCPFSLRHEWEVYSRLWKSQVPVAEPLWYDEGLDFAGGRAHMVRRLVDGGTSIPGLGDATAEGEKLRKRVAFECAEKLALVHTLDWKAIGLDTFMPVTPPSPRDALKSELRYWRGEWERGRPGPYPLLEEALCWLEESLPTDTPRISLIKGNNGVGEEIWRGDRIVAMSDWELACLGDGALDLAFSQGTLTLGNFGETLAHYEKCVGAPVSPQRLAAANFVIWFKQIVLETVYMYNHYMQGKDLRLPMLTFGLVIAKATEHRMAACIGKDLVEAWASVANHEQSSYFRVARAK